MSSDDKKIEEMLRCYNLPGPPSELKDRIFQPQKKRRKLTWPAIAAGILIAAGLCLLWHSLSQQTDTKTNAARLAQIERSVIRAGQAAQLLAAADLLAKQPGGEEYALEQYLQIIKNYSNTIYAKQAESRIKSF